MVFVVRVSTAVRLSWECSLSMGFALYYTISFIIFRSHQEGLRTTRAIRNGFKLHVSEDASIAALGNEKARILRAAMKEVTKYWSERLEVKKPAKKIFLNRQCAGPGIWSGVGCPADRGCKQETMCGEVKVPKNHLAQCQLCGKQGCTKVGPEGRGISGVDMILYMSAKVSNLCRESATLSHASHCQQVNYINLLISILFCLFQRKQLLTDQ